MRTQQEVERAEQQRIKNLVLNYDLTDDQHDGIDEPAFHYVQSPNSRRSRLVGKGSLNKSLRPAHNGGGRPQRSTSHKNNNDEKPEKQDKASSPLPSLPVNTLLTNTDSLADDSGTFETLHGQPRVDKSGNTRSKQRSRKLQLSDVDWYGQNKPRSVPKKLPPAVQPTSLDDYIVDKKQKRGTVVGRGERGQQQQQV